MVQFRLAVGMVNAYEVAVPGSCTHWDALTSCAFVLVSNTEVNVHAVHRNGDIACLTEELLAWTRQKEN